MSYDAIYGAQVRYELVAGQQAEARAMAAADRRARAISREGRVRQWPGLGRWLRAWRTAGGPVEAPREERRPAQGRPAREAAAPPAA